MSKESDKTEVSGKIHKDGETSESEDAEVVCDSSSNREIAPENHPLKEGNSDFECEQNKTSIGEVGGKKNEFDCSKCGEGFRNFVEVIHHDCPKEETEPLNALDVLDDLNEKNSSETTIKENALTTMTVILSSQERRQSESPQNSELKKLELSSSQNLSPSAGKCNLQTQTETEHCEFFSRTEEKHKGFVKKLTSVTPEKFSRSPQKCSKDSPPGFMNPAVVYQSKSPQSSNSSAEELSPFTKWKKTMLL